MLCQACPTYYVRHGRHGNGTATAITPRGESRPNRGGGSHPQLHGNTFRNVHSCSAGQYRPQRPLIVSETLGRPVFSVSLNAPVRATPELNPPKWLGSRGQLLGKPTTTTRRTGFQPSTFPCRGECQCCTRPLQRLPGRSASRYPSVRGRPGAARLRAAGARLRGPLGGPGPVRFRELEHVAEPFQAAAEAAGVGGAEQVQQQARPFVVAAAGQVHRARLQRAPCQYKDKSPPPWRRLPDPTSPERRNAAESIRNKATSLFSRVLAS